MFRFMMGELAVCIFLAVLVAIVVFTLVLAGYALKYLAVLAFTLLLPFASMLKVMLLRTATVPTGLLKRVEPLLVECRP